MSKIAVDLKALFTDNSLLSPGAGEILSKLNRRIEHNDIDLTEKLGGRAYDVAATTSFDVNDLSGYRGEAISLQSIRLCVVHIVKTAETVSGTFAVASTPLGITSGTIITNNGQVEAMAVGDVIHSYVVYSKSGIANGSGNDLTITLGTPVGFKAQVLIVGDITD